MKKYIVLSVLILYAFEMRAQITFQKTFGDTLFDYTNFCQQTTDGGYIISASAGPLGQDDILLLKIDSLGNFVWGKSYGGANDERGFGAQQTMDGGYIVAGRTNSFGNANYDVYLIKTDASGNTVWSRTYGGVDVDMGLSVQQTMDSGYIVGGVTKSFGAGLNDIYIIKTDVAGSLLWSKTFGGSGDDYGNSIRQTLDGGYIVAGETRSFGAGDRDVYLIKTNMNGDTLWSRTYGGGAWDYTSCVQQTSDSGYIIVGGTYSFSLNGSNDVYLIKTNAVGDTLWTKTYSGFGWEDGLSVRQTSDSGYIISGYTTNGLIGNVYLIKADFNGNELWTKTFGGTIMGATGISVCQTNDRGYFIAGGQQELGSDSDIYLIKTDSVGNSGCSDSTIISLVITPPTVITAAATIISVPATVENSPTTFIGNSGILTTLCISTGVTAHTPATGLEINISPNPFDNKITVTASSNVRLQIALYDLTSRKLLQQPFATSSTLNTAYLSKGIYIYEVKNNNEVIKKGKLVKE